MDDMNGVAPVKAGAKIMAKVGTMVKVAVVGVLILVLLVPLGMIKQVVRERSGRYNAAVRQVTATWGQKQVIAGPVLVVPYGYEKTIVKTGRDGQATSVEVGAVAYAHFLPDELNVESVLDSKILHRGIYEAVVYGGDVNLKGKFARPDLEQFDVKKSRDIHWDKAYITLAVSDMRGTRKEVVISFAGKPCKVEPGCRLAGASSGVTAALTRDLLEDKEMEFDVTLSLNGSEGIRFAPVGKKTVAKVSSPWPDPSFQGGVLPTERKISEAGFEAMWELSYYGRGYPQSWTTAVGESRVDTDIIYRSVFGVDLINVVDSYRFVERSIKYGMLFIVLVFTAFFLFEVMSAVKVHPFQYILVGAALCLFYLALLSLSEVIAFGLAYGIGATAAVLMISLYSSKMLKSKSRGFKVFLGLSAVYGILYVILRQQDYSLLYGTIGLFVALAVVMYTTRNVDWYAKDKAR